MATEENVFTFEINESLYFRQDQEVQEMTNISLNPEITIQLYDDYVSVRGVLELTGEYRLTETIDHENDDLSFEDYTVRYVSNVEETSNNYAIFSHLFPVEISIPSYRVNNFDDVTVAITNFDYEINDGDQLFITSEISIYGIDESNEKRTVETKVDSVVNDNLTFDIKNDEYDYEEKHTEKLVEDETPKVEITESTVTEDEYEMQKGDSIKREQDEKVTNQSKEKMTEQSEVEEHVRNIAEESDVDTVEENEESPGNFLSTLFTESDEENTYAQVRLCFVQSEDTIETIAKRYEVPTLQIVQYNHLEDGQLHPGELLYIPQKRKGTNH